MLLSALILPASAATITVGPAGDYPTIGEAIAAAAPGDTIDLSVSEYTEDLAIGADLTLAGNGSTLVGGVVVSAGVVDIGDLDIKPTVRGIDVRNATLALHGISVTGGTVSTDGGASLLAVTATVTITDSTFEDGVAVALNGGHIYATGSDLEVDHSSFTGGRSEKGGGIWANASTVTVRNSTFTDNAVRMDDEPSRGGAIRTQDTALVVEDSTFAGNQAQDGYGGAIATFGGTLQLTRCTVGTSEASSVGGALSLTDTPATIADSTFTGNVVTADAMGNYGYGGALIVNGTTAPLTTIDRSTFTSNISEAFGGAVRVEVGDVAMTDTRFESNQSGYGGAIHFATTGAVTLERTDFVTNVGSVGSAIRWRPPPQTGSFAMHAGTVSGNVTDGYGVIYLIDGARVDIDAVTFDHNEALAGGGTFVNNVPDVRVRHSLFCGNTVSGSSTQSDGAGLLVYLSGTVQNLLTNNVFVDNVAGANGGGLRLLNSGDASVINNTFVGNSADFGGGAIAGGTGVLFQNNVVAYSTAGDGLHADVDSAAVVTYDDFFDNVADPVGDNLDPLGMDPTVLDADPLFIAYSGDGDCTNDDLHPRGDSPLLDAGDPNQLDPDGTRSDIGAYGGPDATVIPDTDNDGVPDPEDCNPTDAFIHPGADEIPYDGIDQDCDGADLSDVDADGFDGGDAGADCDDEDAAVHPGAEEVWYDGVDADCSGGSDLDRDLDGSDALSAGGTDCNDEDPAINPTAEDVAGDGIDQDCDGSDASASGDTDGGGKGCGCATGSALGWPSLLPLLLVFRRARRRRSPA